MQPDSSNLSSPPAASKINNVALLRHRSSQPSELRVPLVRGPQGHGVPGERFLFAGVKEQVLVPGVVIPRPPRWRDQGVYEPSLNKLEKAPLLLFLAFQKPPKIPIPLKKRDLQHPAAP